MIKYLFTLLFENPYCLILWHHRYIYYYPHQSHLVCIYFSFFIKLELYFYSTFHFSGRILGSRRESSTSAGPPSTDPLGSMHNLQLDIMDDIVQSRKARMKLWNTSSEQVCEVETLNEDGASSATPQRYANRRLSDCRITPSSSTVMTTSGGCTSTTISTGLRRKSEIPLFITPTITPATSANKLFAKCTGASAGLLSTRPDKTSILNTLTSSAMEINKYDETVSGGAGAGAIFAKGTGKGKSSGNSTSTRLIVTGSSSNLLDPNEGRSTRSNSFDVSILNNAKQMLNDAQDNSSAALTEWFAKRHQPIANKKTTRSKSTALTLSKDVLERLQAKDSLKESKPKLKPRSKQKNWAGHTKGTIVDAAVIGTAIEGFLRKNSTASSGTATGTSGTTSGHSIGVTISGVSGSGVDSGVSGASGSSHSASGSSRSHLGRGAVPKDSKSRTQQATNVVRNTLNWFSKGTEDDAKDTCDTSLCSTLKDLFVK